MRRHYSFGLALTVLLLGATVSTSFALDAPMLSLGQSGHGKQAVIVTAGNSGLPDGFTLRWMDDNTFNSHGQVWPEEVTIDEGTASFTGTPTLNTFGMYTTFQLGPNESITVEVGDLFQETGVTGTTEELEYGKRYNFTAFANSASGGAASSLSSTVSGYTTQNQNCTYTQGYWKNHEEVWPVAGLTLGSVFYTKAQLLDILHQSVQGNGLVSLAHQLIAAKLNVANGADPTAASATITAADAQIGGLIIPPVGSGYIHPSQTSSKTQVLDNYNNGIIGPGHCGTVGVQAESWSGVKASYR